MDGLEKYDNRDYIFQMKDLSFSTMFSSPQVRHIGQSTYDFLNLDVSAHEAALAGSMMARTDDPTGFYYNPALSVACEKTAP